MWFFPTECPLWLPWASGQRWILNALHMSSKTLWNLLSASTTITSVIPNDEATSSMKLFAIISAFIFQTSDEITNWVKSHIKFISCIVSFLVSTKYMGDHISTWIMKNGMETGHEKYSSLFQKRHTLCATQWAHPLTRSLTSFRKPGQKNYKWRRNVLRSEVVTMIRQMKLTFGNIGFRRISFPSWIIIRCSGRSCW